MAEEVTKADILARIRTEREKLEQVIAGLTEQQMTAPVLDNGWSVKDTLAHIAVWEAELITALMQISLGQKPGILNILAKTDAFNAQVYAEQKDRPLPLVLGDFRGIFPQLMKRISGFNERDLTDPERWPWAQGTPLSELIAVNTYEHYAQHYPALRAWRAGSKQQGS